MSPLFCFYFCPLTLKLNNYLLHFQTFFNILEHFLTYFLHDLTRFASKNEEKDKPIYVFSCIALIVLMLEAK